MVAIGVKDSTAAERMIAKIKFLNFVQYLSKKYDTDIKVDFQEGMILLDCDESAKHELAVELADAYDGLLIK